MNSKLLILDLDDTLFPRLPDGYTKEQLQSIKLFSGAKEILSLKDVKKTLVSKGNPLEQYEKLKILGIKNHFDLVLVPSTDEEKKICFQQAMKTFPAEYVFIVGDRIDSEIKFGNELGLITILLRQGKYKNLVPQDAAQVPQYVITSFQELLEIIS